MYGLAVVVLVLWAVVGAAVGVPEELACGRGCRCWFREPRLEKEYRVICNDTTNQELMLTEAVFGGKRPGLVYKTYVRVETAASLLVTPGFVQWWRGYHSCALDVWSVDDLSLPEVTPMSLDSHNLWEHVFAGVGLVNVSVGSFPAGLFSGKQRAGLRLTNCTVGRLSSELLRDAKALKYLEIRGSSVGLFDGPLGGEDLVVKGSKRPVHVSNSTIGRLGEEALRLTAPSREDLVLRDVVLGEVAAGAVNLSGRAKLVLDRCRVADLHRLALTLQGDTAIAITNSTLIARHGALSRLPCAFFRHHIHSNRVVVLPQGGPQGHTRSPGNHTSLERLTEVLEGVLHPTCVEKNLPAWLYHATTDLPSLPQPRTDHSLLRAGLYSFVCVSGLAIVAILVLACLLVRARRRRRHRRVRSNHNQVVMMSQLAEDPIYEEPAFLRMGCSPPPPIPPVNPLLVESCNPKWDGCRPTGAASQTRDDCCALTQPVTKVVENDYVAMH